MNIKIYKHKTAFRGIYLKNHMLLEMIPCNKEESFREQNADSTPLTQVMYYIYDLENNTHFEVAPGMKKFTLAKIDFLPSGCEHIYFTTYSVTSTGGYRVYLMRYRIDEEKIEEVYSVAYKNQQSLLESQLHFFLFNDSYMLIQTTQTNEKRDCCHLVRNLEFYSIRDRAVIEVKDENLTINGINHMIPISDNMCLIKTGFSLMEQNRFQTLNEREVCVEGIYIINREQLVSDLILQKENVLGTCVDRTYYETTIPYATEMENFVVYSKVSKTLMSEEIIFYDYKEDKKYSCISQNIQNTNALMKPYVLDGKPCIRLDKETCTEFVCITTNETIIKLDCDQKIEAVLHDMIIISHSRRKLFSKKVVTKCNVYKYPGMTLLHEEKGEFQCAISPKPDELYLFL